MKFFVDYKCTVWQRVFYEADVNSKEELIKKYGENIINTFKDGEPTSDCELIDSTILFDTVMPILPEDNQGNPTVEIYDMEGNLLMDNVNNTSYKQ